MVADSNLNSVKDIVSKALQDGQINESDFKTVLDEMEKYNNLKQGIKHSKTQKSAGKKKRNY